ncbi:MAG: hypothetical protein R8K49_07090 [Mariprofundaceae bacterium]
MKELHTSLPGFHSTIGSHHLESKLKTGSYDLDSELKSYGIEERRDDSDVVVYRTDKGIAIDLKQYNQHIMLSTINNGDVLTHEVWEFITESILQELDAKHQPNSVVQNAQIQARADPYVQCFLSHLNKFEAEFDSDYVH